MFSELIRLAGGIAASGVTLLDRAADAFTRLACRYFDAVTGGLCLL